ncbi:hypothetical protein C6P40_003117 [Pichia californica]|uniref:FAD dependent oxidoreductase domain-containing protein n=1 Tax=Pichia californica TaxID=460514 RepID=A0A9P6WGW5_9ASCO|nr:hypothetical protein C6P42_004386 [[Candida] californica]KAG0686955.1 hypothetical protein C6P40_003117 [[Candida] californica]
MTKIVVVGAGIIGLTVAHELLKDESNQVTIIAQQFPTDFEFATPYTSPIAGANWCSFAELNDKFTQEIDKNSYLKFQELIKNVPQANVTARKDITYIPINKFKTIYKGVKVLPWFAYGDMKKIIGFRELNPSEYDTSLFAYAYEYNGMVIRTGYYMTYLINEMWKMSGDVETSTSRFSMRRATIKSLSEAYTYHQHGRAEIVINCTGLLAKNLLDIESEEKEKLYPVRGVVFVAENTTGMKTLSVVDIYDPEYPEEKLYFMPRREGELIMGGVFQVNNDTKDIDPTFIHRLLSRCKKYLSQHNWENIKIIRTQFGYRPFRKGGYRIERKGNIVHVYGFGAGGFQSSWGAAAKSVELVKEYQNKSKF